MSKGPLHIESLDGLRTLSFGVVFASHAGVDAVPGAFGVTVFFFLSGFLITTLMRIEFQKTRGVNLRNFYLRRILRILPPFYLVLVAAVVMTMFQMLPGSLSAPAVTAQTLHYANFWIIEHGFKGFAAGTGVYWSLAVEEHFYLLFPLLFLLLHRFGLNGRQQAGVLLSLCAAILAWRCGLVYVAKSSIDRTSLASDTRFDSILFGCALAVYGNPVLDPHWGSDRLFKYLLLPLGLLGLVLSFAIRDAGFRETFRYTLQGISLVPVFVCAMRYPDWILIRPLNFRPIAFLGVLSYSLYLMHQVVIYAVAHNFPGLGMRASAPIALAITIGLAWIVHVLIEKPCARLRRHLSA